MNTGVHQHWCSSTNAPDEFNVEFILMKSMHTSTGTVLLDLVRHSTTGTSYYFYNSTVLHTTAIGTSTGTVSLVFSAFNNHLHYHLLIELSLVVLVLRYVVVHVRVSYPGTIHSITYNVCTILIL